MSVVFVIVLIRHRIRCLLPHMVVHLQFVSKPYRPYALADANQRRYICCV